MNARVTILHDTAPDVAVPRDISASGSGDADTFEVSVLSLEQPLMELYSPRQLAPRTPLRIDTADALWLGEVEECSPGSEGFSVRVRLRHVLRDFETLARLAERFGRTAMIGLPVQI